MSAAGRTLAVLALLAGVPRPVGATPVDLIHVAASEGRSLGGHTALQVGAVVYHFQHRAGLLVLDRESDDAFRWRYGVQQNRGMRFLRLAVDDQEAERLRERVNGWYLAQGRHLASHAAWEADGDLLTGWAASTAGSDAGVVVRGAAAFFEDGATIAVEGDGLPVDATNALAAVRRDIAALEPDPSPTLPIRLRAGGQSARRSHLSERHRDLVERAVAIDVFARGRPVRAERLVRLADADASPLTGAERTTLVRWRDRLRRTAERLPRSARPDWGLALLVTVARLQAIDASLAAGRLVLVSAPASPGTPIDTRHPGARAFAREVATSARATLREVRAEVLDSGTGDLTEHEWARFEEAALAVAASAGWGRAGDVVRLGPDDATPAGTARLRGLPRPLLSSTRAVAAASVATRAGRDHARALRAAYGYDLVERNCVTELVRLLAAARPADAGPTALGGLGFVPAVSFARVALTQPASRVRTLPGYRRRRLAAMRTQEPAIVVRLREDNVLTSSLYRGGDDDPAFAFFTDDAVLPRPLYGVANLAVGAAEAGFGLFAAPFDRAGMLRRGLQGMMVSMPELAFLSVRTATMLHADTTDLRDPS